jgi:hypothetical protein
VDTEWQVVPTKKPTLAEFKADKKAERNGRRKTQKAEAAAGANPDSGGLWSLFMSTVASATSAGGAIGGPSSFDVLMPSEPKKRQRANKHHPKRNAEQMKKMRAACKAKKATDARVAAAADAEAKLAKSNDDHLWFMLRFQRLYRGNDVITMIDRGVSRMVEKRMHKTLLALCLVLAVIEPVAFLWVLLKGQVGETIIKD